MTPAPFPLASEVVRISTEHLSVVAHPAHGFVITEFVPTAAGRNLLWQRPDAPLHDLGAAIAGPSGEAFDEEVFAGGWFTMFPVAGIPGRDDAGLAMHGELPRMRWTVEEVTPTSLRCSARTPWTGFSVSRELSIEGSTLTVRTRARNNSAEPVPVTLGEHPCLARDAFAGGRIDMEILSAAVSAEVSDPEAAKLVPGAAVRWPDAPMADGSTRDLRVVPEAADGRHDHVAAVLGGGELSVSSPALSGRFVFRVDTAELPNVLLWEHFRPRRSPWQGDVFSLEVCSAYGRTLDEARTVAPIPVIASGESIEWTVSATWEQGL